MKQGLILLFLFLANPHLILAGAIQKRRIVPHLSHAEIIPPNPYIQFMDIIKRPRLPTMEDFSQNLCIICYAKPSVVWTDCGHLSHCSDCSSITHNSGPVPRCPICRTDITFYGEISQVNHCVECRENIASVGHSDCAKMVLCHSCIKNKRSHCPYCKSPEGNFVELYFPSVDENPPREDEPWEFGEDE